MHKSYSYHESLSHVFNILLMYNHSVLRDCFEDIAIPALLSKILLLFLFIFHYLFLLLPIWFFPCIFFVCGAVRSTLHAVFLEPI